MLFGRGGWTVQKVPGFLLFRNKAARSVRTCAFRGTTRQNPCHDGYVKCRWADWMGVETKGTLEAHNFVVVFVRATHHTPTRARTPSIYLKIGQRSECATSSMCCYIRNQNMTMMDRGSDILWLSIIRRLDGAKGQRRRFDSSSTQCTTDCALIDSWTRAFGEHF